MHASEEAADCERDGEEGAGAEQRRRGARDAPGMTCTEQDGAQAGEYRGEQQEEVGAEVSEAGLDKHEKQACDRCERGPDAAGDAVGALGAKGGGGDRDDDWSKRESDGEGAGIKVASGNEQAEGGAAEEQGAGEEPAECDGGWRLWLRSCLALREQ